MIVDHQEVTPYDRSRKTSLVSKPLLGERIGKRELLKTYVGSVIEIFLRETTAATDYIVVAFSVYKTLVDLDTTGITCITRRLRDTVSIHHSLRHGGHLTTEASREKSRQVDTLIREAIAPAEVTARQDATDLARRDLFLDNVVGRGVDPDVTLLVTLEVSGRVEVTHRTILHQTHITLVEEGQAVGFLGDGVIVVVEELDDTVTVEAVGHVGFPVQLTKVLTIAESELHTIVADITRLHIHRGVTTRRRSRHVEGLVLRIREIPSDIQ